MVGKSTPHLVAVAPGEPGAAAVLDMPARLERRRSIGC